jgi:uncharacterized 2Fe-2S/4Fe-4S cluster protein (DUF4445 family)
MADTIRVHFLPMDVTVDVPAGTVLLDAALDHGINVETLCGGKGICGKCRVRILGEPEKAFSTEEELFSAEELAQGYRLACLHKVRRPLEVEVVPAEDFAAKAFSGLGTWPQVDLEPTVWRQRVQLSPPTLEDNVGDAERIAAALSLPVSFTHRTLRALPAVARRSRWSLAVSTVAGRVVDVERAHLRPPVGLAVDIGTTSIVGMLVNLHTGVAANIRAHSNSQGRYGADVMSRIEFAGQDQGLATLQELVVRDLNGIIEECVAGTGIETRDILALTVVGNTTMMHLFLGLPPQDMGVAPFASVTNRPVVVRAEELGLNAHPDAEVYVLPTVAAFVGADTVGGMLATRMYDTDRTQILIDIGTNTEIVLAHRGELWSASAPAGPAFEGAAIRHGMRATRGAISAVTVDQTGSLGYETIGDVPPLGICGSALIDLAAELYRVGLVDEGGRLHTRAELERVGASQAALALAEHVGNGEGGRELTLVSAEASGTGQPIVFTQADIRQYQLVKAAVATGIEVLLHEAGASVADIDDIFLAGTFGGHVNLASALTTGLVPPVPVERLHYVGNSALEGARMALLNVRYRRLAEEVAGRCRHVELSARRDFTDRFVQNSSFPVLDRANPAEDTEIA